MTCERTSIRGRNDTKRARRGGVGGSAGVPGHVPPPHRPAPHHHYPTTPDNLPQPLTTHHDTSLWTTAFLYLQNHSSIMITHALIFELTISEIVVVYQHSQQLIALSCFSAGGNNLDFQIFLCHFKIFNTILMIGSLLRKHL